jgi:hypothetical protein
MYAILTLDEEGTWTTAESLVATLKYAKIIANSLRDLGEYEHVQIMELWEVDED